MNWASTFLESTIFCTNCFIARASLSCSVLLRPCSATQPSPDRRHRLPGSSLACYPFHGSPPWPVAVGRCVACATRAADPCRFRLVSRSHTRAGSLRVQHVARCGPRAVHAAHVRAQCHANWHTRVGAWGWVGGRFGHIRMFRSTILPVGVAPYYGTTHFSAPCHGTNQMRCSVLRNISF